MCLSGWGLGDRVEKSDVGPVVNRPQVVKLPHIGSQLFMRLCGPQALGDRVEKSDVGPVINRWQVANPPRRPIGNRPQVGNPPHMKTAIFHQILRAAGPG
jgi:hypothetical protein